MWSTCSLRKWSFLALILVFTSNLNAQHEEPAPPENETIQEHHPSSNSDTSVHTEKEHDEEHGEHHTDNSPLFFIIFAVIIGSATRFFLQKSILPFTVSLLIIGLGLGALGRFDILHAYEIGNYTFDFSFADKSIKWASHIDPHLLLYIFLPILIFEAVFAIDVHVFKKTFTNAVIMAVPGILVAVFATAFFVLGLKAIGMGMNSWTYSLALLFGAVVSATDPVAVVSILKELGASKKLGTLIEGESLLNDGTAIVIFMVIFTGITGVSDGNTFDGFIEFFRVSFGGAIVGGIIGWLIIRWVKKVFNDALVETSLIVAAAYMTFFIAEYFFHVSGVLALVAYGLMMASYGKTRISPEVQHFLHEFWEFAAFVANTLIFLIVGVVIAERSVFTTNDLLLLLIIYIGVFIVRAVVIMMFFPAMKRIGYGLKQKDALVLWYGALRGAIGLALALIVAGTEAIPKDIRDQFLFFTAGIVTLTLLINATTVSWVVNKLGLTKLSPAKMLAIRNAHEYIVQSSHKNIDKLKTDRYLKRANWKAVKRYLPDYENVILEDEVAEENVVAESRSRILEKEKASYWAQFKDGLLGDRAYQLLTGEINDILDEKGELPLNKRDDLENLLKPSNFLNRAQNTPLFGKIARQMFFDKLTTSYDCAKGFVTAQAESLKLLESMMRTASEEEMEHLKVIEGEINSNRIEGLTFLRNLGKEYPETYEAITTREAIRTMLNYEKTTVDRLHKRGRLAGKEADKLVQNIENRMKKLRDAPPVFELPEKEELLTEIPWLNELDHMSFISAAKEFTQKVYSKGAILLEEGKEQDGMFIVVRGSIKITINGELIDLLGPGSTVGEIAALKDLKRTATVTADSPVTVLHCSSKALKKLVTVNKEIEETIWKISAVKVGFYLLKNLEPYKRLSENKVKQKLRLGRLIKLSKGESIDLSDKKAVVLNGKLESSNGELFDGPAALVEDKFTAVDESLIFGEEI
ncbi:MAG: cation:proton antiporter [Crocinitomicaceae bacterium]